MTNTVAGRWARGVALVAAAALGLTACGSSGGSDGGSGGTITVWAWEPTLKQVVTDFQAKYPKVHVKLVNAGSGDDQYTALQNAVQAGKGVPDVAQIEYFALSQFALGKSVTDLSSYGAKGLSKTYSPGPWNSVNINGGVYGLPM